MHVSGIIRYKVKVLVFLTGVALLIDISNLWSFGDLKCMILSIGYVFIANIPSGASDIQIIERHKTENILGENLNMTNIEWVATQKWFDCVAVL